MLWYYSVVIYIWQDNEIATSIVSCVSPSLKAATFQLSISNDIKIQKHKSKNSGSKFLIDRTQTLAWHTQLNKIKNL